MSRMMFRSALLLTVVMLSGLFTGCASIIAGGHKQVTVTSNPTSVPVEVYDRQGVQIAHGVTPFQVNLKRGGGYFSPAKYEFKARMPGAPTKVVGCRSGIHGWYWGNLLLGGAIGMLIVDPLTGAMWNPPSVIAIDLTEFATRDGVKRAMAEVNDSAASVHRTSASGG